MPVHLTPGQLRSLELTERIASCMSLVGTIFVMTTFIYSSAFRKPINRLIFYATCGNMVGNAATLMARSGVRAGKNAPLCQLQGFLIQLSIPADALWNLALAINVYLTLFRKYNAQQLKALEWRYHVMCNVMPLIVAVTYALVKTRARGKVYGPATLWCWVSDEWIGLRVATCYAPAWVCIMISFTIYAMAGRRIFMKRYELRAFSQGSRIQDVENPFTSFKTTEVHITSELAPLPAKVLGDAHSRMDVAEIEAMGRGYDRYTVTINSSPPAQPCPSSTPSGDVVLNRQHTAPCEANRAAWGYTKIAVLFFISLLITWVPSSMNRVYSLIYPGRVSVPFTYASSVVLPLMGFWNSVIYIVTSWAACKLLFKHLVKSILRQGPQDPSLNRGRALTPSMSQHQLSASSRRTNPSLSLSDSLRTLERMHEM